LSIFLPVVSSTMSYHHHLRPLCPFFCRWFPALCPTITIFVHFVHFSAGGFQHYGIRIVRQTTPRRAMFTSNIFAEIFFSKKSSFSSKF
jgi:hypothetical protein